MFDWLIGDWRTLGVLVVATLAIYLFASASERFSGLRTLAEMSAFDFVVAVAIGATVGRTATGAISVVQGCATMLTFVIAHRVVGWLRLRWPQSQVVLGQDPIVLIVDGELRDDRLTQAQLTDAEVFSILRQHQIRSVDDVELMVLESSGRFSVFRREDQPIDPRLTKDLDPSDG